MLLLLSSQFGCLVILVLMVGKHTVNPVTSRYDGLMIVACDSDAEDGDQDADELDRGFCVP